MVGGWGYLVELLWAASDPLSAELAGAPAQMGLAEGVIIALAHRRKTLRGAQHDWKVVRWRSWHCRECDHICPAEHQSVAGWSDGEVTRDSGPRTTLPPAHVSLQYQESIASASRPLKWPSRALSIFHHSAASFQPPRPRGADTSRARLF